MLTSCVALGLSILLVQKYGILGVAIGTAVPQIVFNGWILPRQAHKAIQIASWFYVREAIFPVIFPTILLGLTMLYLQHTYPISGYGSLLGNALAATMIYALAVFFITLRREEKTAVRAFIHRRFAGVWS